jgi:hypothetical protein
LVGRVQLYAYGFAHLVKLNPRAQQVMAYITVLILEQVAIFCDELVMVFNYYPHHSPLIFAAASDSPSFSQITAHLSRSCLSITFAKLRIKSQAAESGA